MVYVYQDLDNSDVQVFSSLEKAKEYHNEMWGSEQDWEDCGNGKIHDLVSDYVTIYELRIR